MSDAKPRQPDPVPVEAETKPHRAGRISDLTRYWLKAQPSVSAYVSASIWNSHDAEDVVQQVAEVCATKFAQFDHSRSFLRWALGIARNEVLRYYRKHDAGRAAFTADTLHLIAEEVASRNPELEDRFEALRECLQKVVGRSKQLLDMRYYRDLKAEEIAGRLGLTAGAVRVALCRVRQELAQCLRRRTEQREHAHG